MRYASFFGGAGCELCEAPSGCSVEPDETSTQVLLKTTLRDQDQDQTGRDQDRDQDQGGQDQDQQGRDQDLKKVVLIGLEIKTRSRYPHPG